MAFNFDVVISGISGRFPECDDVETFKKKLYTGDSSEFLTTDERKWKNGFKMRRYHDKRPIPQTTGKYIEENDFDFRAFKFNQLVARSTDVLNRKCLEVGFEAIVDAGINPVELSGANIGVFMTTGMAERDINCLENAVGYMFVLGCSRTMGPNRLSYSLNLTGPSYGNACDPFGSLEQLKLAKRMIQDGTIEGAIVVAANNLAQPAGSYLFEYLRLLTSEEFCRPFDENASGFIRSESSVALFLQREQDAKRIYAKVKFCDTLYDGLLPHTLLGYDEEYLRDTLQKIYERNGGDAIAKDLAFLELSGSAVKTFDTIEANAVADVLFKWRKNSLMVGSIKSSVGHTEATSQLLSVLKLIFVLNSNIIPPNKNISKVDENIRAFKEQKFQVVDENTELSGDMAALNSTGLFGTVNHVVLQKHLKESNPDIEENDDLPRLLLISGRTAERLQKVFKKIQLDTYNVHVMAMTNDVFSTNMPLHTFRGFMIRSKDKLLNEAIEERGEEKRPICFVFSGMGSQWNGMGKQLLNLPVFADAIKRCDAVLKPKSINIYDIILSDDPSIFENITMSFVSIICMQIALVEVLKKLGIKPDMIMGHSVGENGCAYADGCVTLEQAVSISYSRGIASNAVKLVKGMMAAIGKGYSEIKDSLPENIEVACHNSATSCTISGPAEDVNTYVEQLQEQRIFARAVNVSNIAYHSKYIAPAGPKLRELLEPLIPNPKKRSPKWISSSIPEEHWNSPLAQTCSSEYLTNNLLNPVLFEEACKHIPKNAIVIEIAPHGLLQAILKRALPTSCTNIPLTHKSTDQNNLNTLLANIGRLYIAGCEPFVNNLYPPIKYPVPRGTPSISPYCTWFHGDCDIIEPHFKRFNPMPLSREKIIVKINEDSEFSFLKYHRVHDKAVIPTSFFLYLVWRMLSVHKKVNMYDFPILFEKVIIRKNVKISVSNPQVINIMIQGSGSFEVLSRANMKKNSKVVLTGRTEFILDEKEIPKNNFTSNIKEEFEFDQKALNKFLSEAGFQLGGCFPSLKNLDFGDTESTANIEWHGDWVSFLDAALKFQMFSDIRKSKLCYLHTVRRIFINPTIFNTLPCGSSVFCCYDKTTNIFQCNGIQMNDMKWKIRPKKLNKNSTSPSKIRKLRFVSYDNPKCQNLNEFLDLCLQIAIEDFQATSEVAGALNICDGTKQFNGSIKNINAIRSFTKFKITYGDFETLSSKKTSEKENYFLMTEKITNSISNCNIPRLFVLLLKQKPPIEVPSGFTSILSQYFTGKVFCLLKKNTDIIPEIRVEENKVSRHLNVTGKNDCAIKEVIICSKLDSSNLSLMLSKNKSYNLRYLFLSNMKELTNKYKSQLLSKAICNLPVSVLKSGEWGSYRYFPPNKVSSVDEISKRKPWLNNIQIDGLVKVECIRCEGLETQLDDDSSHSENKLLGIEYSGLNVAGERIMGLTSACSSNPISKIDPILTWLVPDEWKLEQAATVPVIYAHIYTVMRIIESSWYKPNPSVVIVTDSKNLSAKGLINLCLIRKLNIYIVIPDEDNVTDLQSEFSSLNKSNFIIPVNDDFDHIVLFKTKGKGANVVVNFLPGFKNIISSMNSISITSLIVETVESNMNEATEFGLSPFLKNCSFFMIPCKISYFLNLPEDEKIYLQKAVKEGILSGFVEPLSQKPTSVLKETDEYSINYIYNSSNQWNSKSQISDGDLQSSSQNLKFVANRSYIIIGGEHSADTCMKIIHWLRERNASNFVVILEKFSSNSRISSQINRLFSSKNITISFKSSSKLNSVEDAVQIINETNKLAPLDSVFFISMESSSKFINYMETATKMFKENIKFVSLFAGGIEEMEARQSRGQPSFVLHGEHFPKNLPEVLNEFEKMLGTNEPLDSQTTLYEILEDSNISSKGGSDQLYSLKLPLSRNIDNLERIGRNVLEDVKFIEMTSKCIKWTDCRGVFPIFVIPSLHAFELESFIRTLMYPVFCANLTENCSSVYVTASKLYQHLIAIQKIGPVTLIGETWNAAIAIELSSLIKKSGRDFKLFVLEGNPIEWKNTINTLNLTKSQEFEKVLNKVYGDEILGHLYPKGKVNGKLYTTSKLSNGNEEVNSAHVCRSLRVLKRQLINAHDYSFDNNLIENTVFFSKHVTQNNSLVLSNSSDVIHVDEDSYDQFIRSPIIKKIVNKHAMFAWQ